MEFKNPTIPSPLKKITEKVNKCKGFKGFTLAEVLITLVIIGVVAAITVPAVLQSTERQETVSKLKKAYSVLQQATTKIATEEGVQVGDFSLMPEDEFFDKFINTVHTMKLCKSGAGCFPDKPIKTLAGSDWKVYNEGNSLITTDGTAFGWVKGGTDYCAGKGISQEDLQNSVGRFIVDLNGAAPPNRFGYDVFFFIMVQGKGVVPAGAADHSDCKKNGLGITCASVVLSTGTLKYQ